MAKEFWFEFEVKFKYPLVVPNIVIAGISPFSIGNTSTQSGSMFQPAMLVYRSVKNSIKPNKTQWICDPSPGCSVVTFCLLYGCLCPEISMGETRRQPEK